MAIQRQGAPTDVGVLHFGTSNIRKKSFGNGHHAIGVLFRNLSGRKIVWSFFESHDMSFVLRRTILLSEHKSTIFTLVHVDAGGDENTI